MKELLELKPYTSELYDTAKKLVLRLKDEGYEAYCVGGCVRDMVLGTAPSEYDITTDATPDEVMSVFDHTVPVGASFGVVLVLEDEFKYEVATYRQDVSYSDGRRPDDVSFSTDVEQDVLRRDFTINGMLYDPITEQVIDYVGGLKDLEKKLIQTIGDAHLRFTEDKLRLIRAVRFGSRFGFEYNPDTLCAIKEMAPQIVQVSNERLRDEIVKIISQENPGKGLTALRETGILPYILPDVDKMYGVEQPPEFHPEGDVFTHTCLVLDYLYTNCNGDVGPELAMGALLHDIGKPPTYTVSDRIRFNGHDRLGAQMSKKICKELKFSNKQVERIESLVREHLKFKDVTKMRVSTLKRFIGMPYFEDHLSLHLADCQASHGMMEAYEFVREKMEEFQIEDIRPAQLLDGNDLIYMGYAPGPLFSEILNSVEEAQLEGEIQDKEQAKKFVSENYPIEGK